MSASSVLRRCDPLLLASRTRLPTLMLARPVRASLAAAPAASSRASGPRSALASPDPRRVPRSRPRLGARPGVDVRAIDRVSTLRVRERAARGAAQRGATAMSAASASASAADGPLFLGLDFGTSGARCVAVDARGDAVAETSAKYPPIVDGGMGGDGVPAGGWAEAWRGALWSLLDQLSETTRARVVSIAVDGTSGTALVVRGGDGEVAYPPMLYNERRDDAVAAVASFAPEGHTTRSASSALCKLHSWWFETDGGRVASANAAVPPGQSVPVSDPRLLHHADWVAFLLHGEMGVTDHNNALKLGFDPGLPGGADGRSGAYPDWILTQPYASMLPMTCLAPGTVAGACATEEAKKRFPNAADVRVVAGTTDSVAAFAAARCTDPGDCVTSLGSSLALKLVSETRVDDATAGVYSHRLCGRWLVGGASNLGGWLLRSNFTDDELVSLTEEVRSSLNSTTGARDGSSLSSVDYFPGVLMGFGLSVEEATARLSADRPASDAEFLRAILSSVARVEARSYAALVSMGASHAPTRVFTAGGGARNDTWSALRSEAMGGVFTAKSPFAEAAYGTALLARMGHYGYDTYVPSPADEAA